MKKTYIKIVLLVLAVFSLASCKKDDTLKNLNVTSVQTLYEPVNNKSVVLQPSATASVYFEWQSALAEDGALTLYQVAFDKVGGDFSQPLYVATADNNGANTHATLTHKQINKIAALAGIASSATGKLIWTVISSKGVNPKVGAVSNTLEVTRLAGFAGVPATDLEQHEDGDQRQAREPHDARLSVRHHHEGGEQRARRGADIAAHLKQRLREAVSAAGRHARHPRSFGMEDRRAHADQHRRQQDQRIG